MDNKNQEINLEFVCYDYYCCTFNLKGEFILYSRIINDYFHKFVWIYSTQTKNNKWNCKKMYKISDYKSNKTFEVICISKYDKVYLLSNDYIYEWDILTEKSIRIFDDKDNLVNKYIENVIVR